MSYTNWNSTTYYKPPNPKLEALLKQEESVSEKHLWFLYKCKSKICEKDTRYARLDHLCPKNPNCFIGIGEEERDKQNLDDLVIKRLGPNPSALMRADAEYIGLKNLGSTCYMNSLLQCLYANLNVRQGVYKWDDSSDDVLTQLKIVFSHLQNGYLKYFAPTNFAKALGLSTSVQQDAQEFYKLFLSYLEERFAKSPSPVLQSLIKDEFSGKLTFQTECTNCHRVSKQEEQFYDIQLNIEGKKKLDESLESYFQNERLEGYSCEECGKKEGEALRAPHLNALPPVLSLTLLRFVFDKETANKKKVMQEIEFPTKLDMRKYVEAEGEGEGEGEKMQTDEHMYTLSAIVCHCGPSANGGHYVCYVYDNPSGKWFRFDDENVTMCKEFPFEKKSPYDYASAVTTFPSSQQDNRINKFDSPYILFYERTNRRSGHAALRSSFQDLPMPLASVEEETSQFFANAEKYSAEQAVMLAELKKEKDSFKEIYQLLPVKNTRTKDCYWISVEWLRKWIKGEDAVIGPIDNSKLVCPHGKLNLKHANRKRISQEAWSALHEKYGGGPVLTHMDTCLSCVKRYFDKKKSKKHSKAEKENIVRACTSYWRDNGYWISRNWFDSWKTASPGEKVLSNMSFDIVCCHGGLVPDATTRMMIPLDAWQYLRARFNDRDLVEFPSTTRACEQCRETEIQNSENQRRIRMERNAEKNKLSQLYDLKHSHLRMRPPIAGKSYCLISMVWLKKWWTYIDSTNKEGPGPVDNSPLVCSHSGIVYNIHDLIVAEDTDAPFDYISEHQWLAVVETYGGAPELKFHVTRSESYWDKNMSRRRIEMIMEPEQCDPCSKQREEAAKYALTHFEDQEIQIREGEAYMHYQKANVRVSHNTTVETLKAAVFQHLNIPIFQQMLFFGEAMLSDPKQILKDFNIIPGSVVTVIKIPESQALEALGNADIDAYYRGNPEEGFKDSILAQGAAPASKGTTPRDDVTDMETQPTTTTTTVSPQPQQPQQPVVQQPTHSPPVVSEPVVVQPPVETEWACGVCTYLNNAALRNCEMCESPKS